MSTGKIINRFSFSIIIGLIVLSFSAGYITAFSITIGQQNSIHTIHPIEKLVIGFIPTEKVNDITPKADMLAAYLESELGVDIEVSVPTSYEVLIEGLRFGTVHAAFMDSGPAWIAHKRGHAQVVAAEIHDGETHYTAALFAKKDSEISSLQDLEGKRIAFTSVTGSSGFILPVGRMIDLGIVSPKSDDLVGVEEALKETFLKYIFSGGYGPAIDLLSKGEVDVAAGSLRYFETKVKHEVREEIKVIQKIGKVPTHVVMTSNTLPDEWRLRVTLAMLRLNLPENIDLIRDLYGVDGLIPTTTEIHLGDLGKAMDTMTRISEDKWGIKPYQEEG